MGSASAHRQAIWDREKAERGTKVTAVPLTPPKKPRPNLHAAACWAVCQVFDAAGRLPVVLKTRMTWDEAERVAGRMRDNMSDAEVERALSEGWNYVAKRLGGYRGLKVENATDGAITLRVKGWVPPKDRR